MSGKPNKPAGGPPMGGPGHGPGGRHARAMGGKPKETKQTIKRLLGYLGKDKKHVIIALVCVVISSLSTLAGSYMLSPIINGITETYDKASKAAGDAGVIINEGLKTLGLGILLMLAIYGIGVISMYLQQRIMIGVSQRALKTLRKDLFDHIQTLPVRYFDTNATGDIMSRFTNDVDVVGDSVDSGMYQYRGYGKYHALYERMACPSYDPACAAYAESRWFDRKAQFQILSPAAVGAW